MKLTLGFSPCPNDTFIFDALVNRQVQADGLEFEVYLEDVETLNQWAKKGRLDITKLSFPAFFQSVDDYLLLGAGSAMGRAVGPLVIAAEEIAVTEVESQTVALPGRNTTADLLFRMAFPAAGEKKYMIFSSIEEAVLKGDCKLGVIIHENRFTYQEKGLVKILDLGEYWHKRMGVPLPLGGIAMKRSFDPEIAKQVEDLIRKSLALSFERYPVLSDYVSNHSQTMSEDVMRRHIELYVNQYSRELGEDGRKAVQILYEICGETDHSLAGTSDLFL